MREDDLEMEHDSDSDSGNQEGGPRGAGSHQRNHRGNLDRSDSSNQYGGDMMDVIGDIDKMMDTYYSKNRDGKKR